MSSRGWVSFRFVKVAYLTTLVLSIFRCKVQHQEAVMDATRVNSARFSAEIPDHLSNSDTSPGWSESESKIMITGTVFEMD